MIAEYLTQGNFISLCMIVTAISLLYIYFQPMLVSYKKRHESLISISILNILLIPASTFMPWCVLFWFGILFWANNPEEREVLT